MNIMPDIIFITKNRLEFTKASLETLIRNTDWAFVRRLFVFDDGSTDGTREYVTKVLMFDMRLTAHNQKVTLVTGRRYGGPASVMIDYVRNYEPAPIFIKIDNDVIVPPQWLNQIVSTMSMNPHIDLLGIEPPESRIPHYENGRRNPQPEKDPRYASLMYAPCDSIGGIGAMRTEAFRKYGESLIQHSVYGGFTEWQLKHGILCKAWIKPSLNLFLLDRLPVNPWAAYSDRYIMEGNQRQWSRYPMTNMFWNWWQNA